MIEQFRKKKKSFLSYLPCLKNFQEVVASCQVYPSILLRLMSLKKYKKHGKEDVWSYVQVK